METQTRKDARPSAWLPAFSRMPVAAALIGLLLGSNAMTVNATNGAYLPGYSPKALAMGGGGTALPEDALTVHNNVAGLAVVDDQITAAVTLYSPWTKVDIGSVQVPTDLHWFPAPGLAWRHGIGANKAIGFALYGNGGIGNHFQPSFLDLAAGGGSPTGIPHTEELSISQISMLAVPSFAMRVNDQHALGVGLVFGLQTFKAEGLALFGCVTPQGAADPACALPGGLPAREPAGLTNEGTGKSLAIGLRFGWLWQANNRLDLGVGATTPLKSTRMREYRNLLPDHGAFDQPGEVNLGLAWHATPAVTIALDWQRTFYAATRDYGNPGPLAGTAPTPGQLLGKPGGYGFGWNNQDIYRLGLRYAFDPRLTLRAGFNYSESPVGSDQISFALLNPGIMERSVHAGATWRRRNGDEVTVSFFRGFREQLRGVSVLGPAQVTHHEYALGLGYNWR
ncbi:OmpP1/FadL family transporter [Immundisolibacter sp.]|uniref:OmpP1/FadL family transporter n=3 Tax=Immundisolibacter sp. TaxID=1934948 RepID=UPI003568E317